MIPIIDLVYCWVDGSCPEHQVLRAKYTPNLSNEKDDNWRHRSNGEIYASIHSACVFAPWLRHIWIVVDDIQIYRLDQSRLICSSKVTVVPHSLIYQECLHDQPTFNSQSIESQLAQIPGLADLFLYANDDTFFGAPCEWTHFYTDNLLPKAYFLSTLGEKVIDLDNTLPR